MVGRNEAQDEGSEQVSARSWRGALAAAVLVLAGCEERLEGPAPAVDSVSPAVACNGGISTVVTINGSGFSPLNTGLLGSGALEMPTVTLSRTKDLDGAAAGGEVVVPDDPSAPDVSDVRWVDATHMEARLCPEGTCAPAEPAGTDFPFESGLYAVTVENRAGKSARMEDALTVVPQPTLSALSSDLLCHDQDNTLVLNGDFFLEIGGKAGRVTVGVQEFDPVLADCRPLPSAAGVDLKACRSATIQIPKGTFTSGTYSVLARNAAPAGCATTTPLTLTLVPEPTIETVEPDVACLAESPRTFQVTGTGFLRVDGQLPAVEVAQASFPAKALGQCVPVTGPAKTVES